MADDRQFCTSCGGRLGPKARFCGACGAAVEDEGGFPARPAEQTQRLDPATPGLGIPVPPPRARAGAPVALIIVAGALAAVLVFAIGLLIWWPGKQVASGPSTVRTGGTVSTPAEPPAPAPEPAPAAEPEPAPAPAVKPAASPDKKARASAGQDAEAVARAFCDAIERGDGEAAQRYVAADAEMEYELDLVGQGDIVTTGYKLTDDVAGARERVFRLVFYYHDPKPGRTMTRSTSWPCARPEARGR